MSKILILANSDMGLYKFRKELINRLLSGNYEVHFSVPKGKYIKHLEEMGAIFDELEFDRSTKNVLKEWHLFWAYKKQITNVKPDIVLLYTLKPSLYAGYHCKKKHIPYIINITGLSPVLVDGSMLGKVILKVYQIVLKCADMVFFQNRAQYNMFREKKLVNKCDLLPGSGVNVEENAYETYQVYDKIRITYVGRLVPIKGISEMLQVIDKITEKRKDIEFRIIGECEKQYESIVKRLEQEGKLIYYGVQDDIHSFMKESNAIILPSHAEGMSNVLLEAAACGRPVLASKIPGCQETFIEGESGLGFEKENAEDMEKTILRFCDLSDKAMEEMGKKGRKYVEDNFSRNIITEKYIKTIKGILEGEEQ